MRIKGEITEVRFVRRSDRLKRNRYLAVLEMSHTSWLRTTDQDVRRFSDSFERFGGGAMMMADAIWASPQDVGPTRPKAHKVNIFLFAKDELEAFMIVSKALEEERNRE